MKFHWWNYTLLLVFLAVGSSARALFADDLQELSRSVRWGHLSLQETRPDDLTIELPHKLSTLQFAEWSYGTPDSPRIAIVVAQIDDGEYVLYVDTNRNRKILQRELVDGAGELRMLLLTAWQVAGDVVKEFPREVLFRFNGQNKGLSVATATRIEHSIHPDGDKTKPALKTRQIDGNANGLFADTKDLLQIDLNHDDRFDLFLETFPFRPLMNVGGQRWFVKADHFGQRLRLESATATGRVRISTRTRSKRDRFTDLIVTLSGEDGSVYSLTGANAITDLPVGRYAASGLFMTIKSEGTDRAWEFTFSREGGFLDKDWLQVSEGKTIEFDPIGELVMSAVVTRSKIKEIPGLYVQPRLFTGSGLLINLCQVDGASYGSGPQCSVSLTDTNGQSIGQSRSGFA